MTTTATLPVEAAATATSTSSAERLRGILARVAPSVLVAIPVALAMAIAYLVWTPPSFRSEALLWIEVRDGASDETALGMLRSRRIAHRVLARDLIDENASAGALSNVLARAASFRWLPGWLHLALPPKHPADLYGEQLRVQRQAESDLVAVRFTSGDPDNAAAVANAHVDAFLAYLTELGEAAPARARLIDEAIPPLARSSPKLTSTLLSAVAIGLIGGLALAVWRRGFDQRLRSAEDVENQLGLPLLGVVPDMISLARWALAQANSRRPPSIEREIGSRVRARATTLHSAGTGSARNVPSVRPRDSLSTAAFDAYRLVCSRIQLSRAAEPPHTILFTSAVRGEGRTSTTLNTARMFAESGKRVLVVDADLRRPQCHELLCFPGTPGLVEVLTGLQPDVDVVHSTRASVFAVAAGIRPPNPSELLGSAEMQRLLRVFRGAYDHILIDAAPILPTPDSLALSTFVDGVVLVVDSMTPTRRVRRAQALLGSLRANVLGVVVNRADLRDRGAGYEYALDRIA